MIEREDRFLSELGNEVHIEDQGFTDGVLARLSPRRRSLRLPILAAFASLSAVVLALVLPQLEPWLAWTLGLVVTFPALAALALGMTAILLGLGLQRA